MFWYIMGQARMAISIMICLTDDIWRTVCDISNQWSL